MNGAPRRIWGMMYRHLALLSPILAAPAGARLLAGPGHVHLGLYRVVPGPPPGRRRGGHGLGAAGRRPAVGGLFAQPDGHGDLLPGGIVVAQSGPCLRQPAAPVGTGRGTDRHVVHPHARSASRRRSRWRGLFYAFNLFAPGTGSGAVLHQPDDHGLVGRPGRRQPDPAPWRRRGAVGMVGAVWPRAVLGGILSGQRAAGRRYGRSRSRCRRRTCSKGCAGFCWTASSSGTICSGRSA